MNIKSLDKKTLLFWTWQLVTILTSLHLFVVAFMQYNWHPDKQTYLYNLIITVVIIAIITLRLLSPKRALIVCLILLDTCLLTISSRAFLNDNFWGSIVSLVASTYGMVVLTIFAVDYYMRFFPFMNQRSLPIEHS